MSYASDRAEIADLMARYLFAMDYNDYDTYAECFAEDGELDYAAGITRGREAIRTEAKVFKDNVARLFVDWQGNPAKLRNRAWNTGLWWEMTNGGPEGSLATPSFGTYEDELVRVEGRWLFKRRKIYNEFIEGRQTDPGNPVLAMDASR
jgi:hypothetical protein